MILLTRFTNILPLILVAMVLLSIYWIGVDLSIYQFGIAILLLNFIIELILAYSLKRKQDSGEIHLFYKRNNEPLFLKWAILALSLIIIFFVIIDSGDTQGWFWLTLFATKGIEHYLHITNWEVIIENNSVCEKSFWLKPILIANIDKLHINDQAHLEITASKDVSIFKLDSGTSVNLRDQIENIQSIRSTSYV